MAIIAALWSQVDYRSKQMAPWHAMSKKPQTADNSLLLDYISPFSPWAFYVALRRFHWAVAAALLGTMLVKLLYVLSTALFILQPLLVQRPIQLSMDSFSGRKYNASLVDNTPILAWTASFLDSVSFPAGTNDQYAVQTFNASRPLPGKSFHFLLSRATYHLIAD
jgi:hypothetical protein